MATGMMWMISDRNGFWDPNALSEHTHVNFVHPDGSVDGEIPAMGDLSGRRVLLLIHGYNNAKEDVLRAYFGIRAQIDHSFLHSSGKLYDVVIGYVWPGYQNPTLYFAARDHADEVSTRVAKLISGLGGCVSQLDVMAHSMGNRILLEALEKSQLRQRITNFFSLGASVSEESIDRGHVFSTSVRKCHQIYLMYSSTNEGLKYLYTLAEFKQALGSVETEDLGDLPQNIQLVDCSALALEHNQYERSPQIFSYLRNRLLGLPPLPSQARSVRLLDDDRIEIVRRRVPAKAAKLAAKAGSYALAFLALYKTAAYIRSLI